MAPIKFASISVLVTNSLDIFNEACDILLRIAQNVIKEPQNPKFQSISLTSKVLINKLLPVPGAMECLFDMGFEEATDSFKLPESYKIQPIISFYNELRQTKDQLNKEPKPAVSASKPEPSSAPKATTSASPSLPSTPQQILLPSPDAPRAPVKAKPAVLPEFFNLKRDFTEPFFQKILSNCERVLQYENKSLQLKALREIPLVELRASVEQMIRQNQGAYKRKEIPEEETIYQLLMLIALVNWFKRDFFKWVDSPDCPGCEQETSRVGSAPPSLPGIDVVEVYRCTFCDRNVYFPRYNDCNRLLETRSGRCGEYANCFTLLCRAMGWDARLVLDDTDHAWTEVYLFIPGRWVHCDPSEANVDAPLIYEAGWKKNLRYILAYSSEEVQDVTWRYSSHHKEVLKRRKMCKEEDLVQLLLRIRETCTAVLSPVRRRFITTRCLRELIDMMVEKEADEAALTGRTSGSLQWRLARGETQDESKEIAWTFFMEGVEKRVWSMEYSAAKNAYFSQGDRHELWNSGVFRSVNIFRKVEKDWKMAYLARTEGSLKGEIVWRFESDDECKIDMVEVLFETAVYKTGKITATLCSGNVCVKVPTDGAVLRTPVFKNCTYLTLTAELTGGEGPEAWQHTQLFRQSLKDGSNPFRVSFTLLPADQLSAIQLLSV